MKCLHTNRRHDAFTLIELSVVLVIVGLIVAAIVAGSSMVASAKLQSGIRTTETINRAVVQFYGVYKAYPGDMDNAYSYWGSACDATPSNCNGDKDWNIEGVTESDKASRLHRRVDVQATRQKAMTR